MKLYEYEGKRLFRNMGIQTPEGEPVKTAEEACATAGRIGYPVVVKAQLLRGGRGKAGVVRFAENDAEALAIARELLAMKVGEEKIGTLLVEKKLTIDRELYAGITFDHATRGPVLLFSCLGGVDIESSAGDLRQIGLDPFHAPQLHEILDLCKSAGLGGAPLRPVAEIIRKLVAGYFQYDALTAEINPLIVDASGRVYAADSKLELDDSAAYRHDLQLSSREAEEELDPFEADASRRGLAYVRLGSGNIGVIAGGAGLCMASMDIVAAAGGRPANFLDLGGGVSREKTSEALRMVLKTPGVEGVLMNLFGGINNCEVMAKGIEDVVRADAPRLPIVVKMRGHSQDEGWGILEKIDIPIVKFGTTEEAVSILLDAVDRRKQTCPS